MTIEYTNNTGNNYQPKLNKKDQEALDLVIYRFREYLGWRKKNYDKKWDSYHAQYRSILENESEYPFRARLFIPYSFTAVETAIPRMVEAIFSSDPIVAVKPEEQNDANDAKLVEQVLGYQFRKMDYLSTFIPQAKDVFVIGSCFGKVDWREEYQYKKRIAREIVPDEETGQEMEIPVIDDNGKPVLEKVPVQLFNDAFIYYVDPYKFLMDPKASPVDPIGTSEAVILITETTIKKLKQMEELGIYKKISEVEKCKGSIPFYEGEERFTNVDVTKPSQFSDKHSDRVLLYEYWEDDRVIVVAEEKVVIRDEPNPFWHCRKPFIQARICPTNEIYGIGFMEMIRANQNEINDRHNQRADNITLALNRMYIIARDADVDYEMLLSEPGGIILSNYPDGVTPLAQPDVTQSAFAEIKELEDTIDRTLGIHDPSRGKPTDRQTATGTIALQEQANMRFKLMIMEFSRMLARAAEFMVDLNEQFMPEEKEIRLTGGVHTKIDKFENIVHRYDFIPVAANLEGLSKYAKADQLIRARQIFADNEDLKKSAIDADIMDFMNFKDPARYFYTPEEKQQMMMQQVQQQMMMQGVGQGGQPGQQGMGQPPMGMPPMPGILPGGEGAPPPEYAAGAGRPAPILTE